MYRLTKISKAGRELPADAKDHVAVRLDHDLLARPLYFDVGEHKAASHQAAIKWMEKRKTCGWQWRASTRLELCILTDLTKFDPCLDKNFFPNVKSDWYYAADVAAGPSGGAWVVYFYNGHSYWYLQGYYGWCRAVRAGQY